MLDNNEDFKINYQSNNHEKSSSDDWQEINDLLDYAEKLKSRCDGLSDRIFFLNTVQLFLAFSIIAFSVTIFGLVPGLYLDVNLSRIAILLIYFGATLSFLFIEALSRILRIRISTDKRGLDSTIDFLRENSYLFSKDWSRLEKIQLKIKLSLFDINTSISPWSKLKKSFSGDFLLWLAGVDASILAIIDLKRETSRYKVIGFMLLLTFFLFFISGYSVFSNILIGNQAISIFLGLIWAVVIFSVYRFVLVSTSIVSPKISKVNLLMTNVLRVVLAILIALTISVPIELMIFKPEIESRISEYSQSVVAHVIEADNEIKKIDDKKKFIDREIFAANNNVIRLKEKLMSEITGNSNSSKGIGQIAQIIMNDIEKQLEKQSDLISKSERSKDILEKERQERVLALEEKYHDTIKNSSLVARIDAFRQLTKENYTVTLANIVINIIVIGIEIIPITARLLMNDTLYEKVLRRKEAEILMNKQEEELQKDVTKKDPTNEDELSKKIRQDLMSKRLLSGIHDE
jgi:Domain of unknown function (DUF4407)